MKKQPRIIELLIDETIGDIVDVVSVVDMPAIEIDFMKFNSEPKQKIKFNIDNEEQRIITGPVMLHSKYIYRYDSFTDEEYYVYFSRDTVKKAMELFMKHGSTKSTNLNHESTFFDGVSVIESWIDGERAKSTLYDLEPGNWFMTMKVDNDMVWEEIKAGTFKGFSLEGYFSNLIKMRKESSVENDLKSIVSSSKDDKNKMVADLYNYIIKMKLDD
jgi:hypothetical protein